MEQLKWSSCGFLPILLGLLLSVGVLVSYVWAVIRKDVVVFIPFISDAGGYPPQSGVFAIFLFSAAFIGFFAILIRYISIKSQSEGKIWLSRFNIFSVLLGIVSMGGMIIVASYPVNTKPKEEDQFKSGVLLPHTLGAFTAFAVGLAFAVSQTILSFLIRSSKSYNSKQMIVFYIRCSICTLAFVALIVMSTAPVRKIDDSGSNSTTVSLVSTEKPNNDNPWTKSKGREVSIFAEWVLAFSLFAFFVSLYPEMKEFGVQVIVARQTEFHRLNEPSSQATSHASLE